MPDPSENVEPCEPARRTLRTWADIVLAANRTLRARTVEFTSKGLAIVASSNLPAKTPLEVNCVIPMRNGKFASFNAKGHVTHSIYSSQDNGFRIGIAFDEVPRNSAVTLQQLVG